MLFPLSPAHLTALTAFQLYAVLLFVSPRLAVLPLALFILVCLVAPALPRFSFYLPIVSRGRKGAKGVALTFDDGPDPVVTPRVLELLARHGLKATFFVVGEKAERHPDLIRAILAQGHRIGNHSHTHPTLLMLKGRKAIAREVEQAQAVLKTFGIVPLAFRPPVGITNPALWPVLLKQGMFCLNFNRRALDRGNRRITGLADRILRRAQDRDIILLHDTLPHRGTPDQLLNEFERLITGLGERGLAITPLQQLIGKEVMETDPGTEGPNATRLFYDGLAAHYDHEQFCSGVSRSRLTEQALFNARVPQLLNGTGRVLEIGAGTGIFTLELARHCQEVVAVDISPAMLKLLEAKAEQAGVTNIRPTLGNVETLELEGPYSLVCAFSALEYLTDLEGFIHRLSPHMAPGGVIYFITARRSLFRLFTQIGNAMRQGIWLKARSRGAFKKMLTANGFEHLEISAHLLKSWISGGMLLEVVARKKA
jgi:peptidoglycan/xylan/chitin deacetylase (PgdA/CDA1 family)/SAM-dependent methyltransferase